MQWNINDGIWVKVFDIGIHSVVLRLCIKFEIISKQVIS